MNIVQYFCTSEAAQSDWLMWQLSHLSYHKHLALFITLLQTYLAHLQFAEAQQATSKAELLEE